MKNLITIILLGITLPCLSQQITKTDFYQSGKQLIITYDLVGATNGQTFDISLYVSTDNGSTWQGPLEQVSGDVGKNLVVGKNSSITWNVLREFAMLKGKIGFRVQAKVNNPIIDKNLPDMVFVKGGTFQMGCNERENEKPVHSVTVDDFYMGKYEVTQKQWQEIMGTNPSSFKNCDNCPVEKVSWNDIQKFIKKLNTKTGQNYRLPTEAEWEYAARGGNQSKGYQYAGSNTINEVAWYGYDKSGKKTHQVGTKKANELGIYDMSGNVWESCSDWYASDYYKNSPSNNPEGPISSDDRVIRGGAWNGKPDDCRVTYRTSSGDNPYSSYNNIGFRVVRH
jgi:formylglycine-generating enzyme required for sulfatase activity